MLAGDRLLVASTDERMLSISPYTGEVLGELDIPPTHLAPIVVDGTLYLLSDDATLTALR